MLPENQTPKSGESTEGPKKVPAREETGEETQTQVPNAHASGLGAMGRNDEKLPTSADDADDRPEAAY